jgi:hypothetical protein
MGLKGEKRSHHVTPKDLVTRAEGKTKKIEKAELPD